MVKGRGTLAQKGGCLPPSLLQHLGCVAGQDACLCSLPMLLGVFRGKLAPWACRWCMLSLSQARGQRAAVCVTCFVEDSYKLLISSCCIHATVHTASRGLALASAVLPSTHLARSIRGQHLFSMCVRALQLKETKAHLQAPSAELMWQRCVWLPSATLQPRTSPLRQVGVVLA